MFRVIKITSAKINYDEFHHLHDVVIMLQYFANHLAILQTDLHALEKHAFYDKYKIARSYCKILHCMKSVRIRSFLYSVSLRIQSECGEIRTRKTPNMNTFHTGLLSRVIPKTICFYLIIHIYTCHQSLLIWLDVAIFGLWLKSVVCYKKKEPPQVFYKKSVLKNFAKFTGKHLKKRGSSTGVFLWIWRNI